MTGTIILARAEFAFTVGFHILLPTFSIGLASYLAVLEGLWLTTGRQVYFDVYKYWLRIFAVGFAMGVVSGVALSYRFGTNWARFSDTAGPIVGPLMAYEVFTAFFLEAGFLGVMLFGLKRVGPRLHFVATCWLILRTEGELQRSARSYARALGLAVLGLIVVISLWTPMLNDIYWKHWVIFPQILLTAPVPILVILLAWAFWRGLQRHDDLVPLLCAQAWFLLCYAGLGISIWPMIVPPSISIWDAAAPPSSQLFLLVGAVILLPMILGYTSFSYWTFRGKVRAREYYQ
jgi:Cytochrome bd terminal oxidase subunit I/Cytochrome bd terminal oxidase subunit II